ncbi:MAG TPA: amidohydrolase family protein [Candidatus Binatia bacterium]|nr:amidohydrolase family protein [Candidatus Binatia bacterium]
MHYERISADCHIDLCWLPPDLFTANARPSLRDRMPYVIDGPKGPVWVSRGGGTFGLANGMGSAGREYVPGQIHRSDRMASTGLYEDGKKGIRRLSDPDLRLRDQERDGVQAEVLYGILGSTTRINDDEAAVEMIRVYNEWLADFCDTHPERYAGLACVPSRPVDKGVEEVQRVVKRGGVRGLDVANTLDMPPLWDPSWNPLWDAIDDSGLPLHFHTVGGRMPDAVRKTLWPSTTGEPVAPPLEYRVAKAGFAVHITGFQIYMSNVLMSMIYGGVLERHPRMRMVIGEGGIGWIPYILDRMDLEWEDQFKDLGLSIRPSEYWRRQCKATFQSDRIGIALIDELGEDNIMWASDFPHPDGIWPDSAEYIERELGGLSPAVRRKVVCENAGKLYGFMPA